MDATGGMTWGEPVTRDAWVGMMRCLDVERRSQEETKHSRLLSETQWERAVWDLGLLSGFLFPCTFNDQGDQQAVLQPHFQLYRQHLARNSALALDFGNLWFLHWLFCQNDLHLWGGSSIR